MAGFLEKLKSDFRVKEGLKACIHCGTCTAVCPAAAVTDYDPRMIVDAVQCGNESEINQLLRSDSIWYCGECLSCKTRCPRGNTPGYVIQALRSLSVETGLFIESREGQKQLLVKRTVGDHILKYGYCVYIDEVDTVQYPEQGPVWDWLKANKEQILEKLGTSYKKDQPGTLRQTSEESLQDLKNIFDVTGATQRFRKIERLSSEKAREMGIDLKKGKEFYYAYLNKENEVL